MTRRISLSPLLAVLSLLIALLLRVVDLGALPLMPAEAAAALEAAARSSMGTPFWEGGSAAVAPSYLTPTSALMTAFGVRTMVARLVPALAGAMLVALPLLLRRRLGWPVTLLTMGLLAVSTASLTASRTAGGETMAVLGVALAVVLIGRSAVLTKTERILAGAGLGLALASGSAAWMGFFGLGLAVLFGKLIRAGDPPRNPHDPPLGSPAALFNYEVLISAAVISVLLSTAFGTQPRALTGFLAAPGRWLLGWGNPSGWSLISGFFVLLVYEPLLLILGGVGVVGALRRGPALERLAALWALGALTVYLLYPARNPLDILWLVVPLSLLTASQVIRTVEAIQKLEMPLSSLMLALVLLVIFSYAFLQLEASLAGFGLASLDREAQLVFALSALGFALLLVLLFGVGWSWRETLLALAASATVVLAMLSVSSSWRLNYTRQAVETSELWRREVTTLQLPLLEETLSEIAKTVVGRTGGMPIEVIGDPTASLAWGLREHKPASQALMGEDAPAVEAPPVIIARETVQPSLPADYLGQAYAIKGHWGWPAGVPTNPLQWLMDRQGPLELERWILYVRTDVAAFGTQPDGTEVE